MLAAQSTAVPGAVNLPAFSFKTDSGLKPALMALGMNQAFDASVADLSAIDGKRDLYVSDVLHQATIAVDEMGTEASAATAVVIRTLSAVLSPLAVDRRYCSSFAAKQPAQSSSRGASSIPRSEWSAGNVRSRGSG